MTVPYPSLRITPYSCVREEYAFLQQKLALGMGLVFVGEKFPMDFGITRSAVMLDKPVVRWILCGMHTEINSSGTLALVVSFRFTLELLSCLELLAHHYIPDLENF